MSDSKEFRDKVHILYREMASLSKDGYNSHHKYSYVSADQVRLQFGKALQAAGLWQASYTQDLLDGGTGHVLVEGVVSVTDGKEHITASAYGEGKDSQDKAAMKATTAAYKNTIAALCIAPWDGMDPEHDDHDASAQKPSKAKRTWGEAGPALKAALESGEAYKGMKGDITLAEKGNKLKPETLLKLREIAGK